MRHAISRLTDAVHLTSGEARLTIGPGAVVDLDQRLGATTVGAALGSLVEQFTSDRPLDPPAPPPAAARPARRTRVVADEPTADVVPSADQE